MKSQSQDKDEKVVMWYLWPSRRLRAWVKTLDFCVSEGVSRREIGTERRKGKGTY